MNDETVHPQATIFSGNWQAWLVLRHFLPARLQRVLVQEVVREASQGKIRLGDLLEDVHVDAPIWNESWMVRPRTGVQGYAGYLQGLIRAIVWQIDKGGGGHQEEKESAFVSSDFLDALMRLSVADFGWPETAVDKWMGQFTDTLQSGLQCLLQAFKVGQRDYKFVEAKSFWETIAKTVESVDIPLRAMMLKHIADLCADVDAWKHALKGYEEVGVLLDSWSAPTELKDLSMAWKGIVTQCRACALGTVEQHADSANLLNGALDASTLDANPVLCANLALDAVNAQSWLESREFKDRRISLLSAPLLHASHDASVALGHWLNGKHQDASERFWSVLRRQIALGAATELRVTKGWYGRNLLDQVSDNLAKHDTSASFEVAIRLLIEAERPETIGHISWSQPLVDACVVKQELVDRLVEHAAAFEGVKLQRTKVLVELFKTWTVLLTPSRTTLAHAMWKHVAKIAREFGATFEGRTDVGRPALKALQELGKKRPELRDAVAVDVADAVCQKLSEEFDWGRAEAVQAALPYVDAFDADSLRKIVKAILDVLGAKDPAQGFWPLYRPALRFLVDRDVRKRLRGEEELNRQCLKQIFRFGLAEENGHVMLFFHLADFDAKILEDETARSKLSGPLEYVRRVAVQINRSDVTDHIQALLVAPFIAGHEGIADALEGLERILDSAKAKGGSMGLPQIDRPLLLLTEMLDTIRSMLAARREWFEERLSVLADRLTTTWELAATKPLLFAPFAFPPRTKPDHVVVHNCAFASLRFAQAIGKGDRMREALGQASENPELRSAILLARATNASGIEFAQVELDDVPDEDRDSFYRAIGRRLTQLQRLPKEDAQGRCKNLVAKCFRLGPHPSDAAVLLTAAHLGLDDYVRASGLRTYAKRIETDHDNRLLLLPILNLFWTDEMKEELDA